MTNQRRGLVTKVIRHGDTLIILAAIASMFFYFDAKFATDNERFFEQQKQFSEQQKQFSDMIEKIAEVEKQSLQRDHALDIELAKLPN